MKRLIATCCLLAALAACKPSAQDGAHPSDNTAAPPATSSSQPATSPAKAAPTIPSLRVTTLDGAHYDLAAHRGKWVVVNFWATWCAPCLKEMPELSALHAMRDNIEVVGLAYEDIEPAEMQAFLKAHPVAYPIAIVDTYQPPADFAVPRGLPMSYLIGPDGKVAKQFLGPVEARDIEAAITAAGGKAS